jgi:hypothetical protein
MVCSVAVFLIAIIFLHYYLFHRIIDFEYQRKGWGGFFIPDGTGIAGSIMFVGERLFDMIVGVYNNKVYFAAPFNITRVLNVVIPIMFVCGLVNLVLSKRFHILLLLGLPIVVMIFFTTLGFWPFGYIRVNVFIFPTFIFLTMFGFEFVAMIKKWRVDLITKSFMVAVFMIIQFPFDVGYFKKAQFIYPLLEDMPASLRYINESLADQPPPRLENGAKHLILVSWGGREAFPYFTEIHSKNKYDFEDIRTEFEVFTFKSRERTQMMQQMKQILSDYPDREIWFVLYHFSEESSVFLDIFYNMVDVKAYKFIPEDALGGSAVVRTTVRPTTGQAN